MGTKWETRLQIEPGTPVRLPERCQGIGLGLTPLTPDPNRRGDVLHQEVGRVQSEPRHKIEQRISRP